MPDKTDRDIDGLSPRGRGKQTADKTKRIAASNSKLMPEWLRYAIFLLNMNKC